MKPAPPLYYEKCLVCGKTFRVEPYVKGIAKTICLTDLIYLKSFIYTSIEQYEYGSNLLTPRNVAVISRRWGLEDGYEPQTLLETGKSFGLTQERVRQIEGRVLDRLRDYIKDSYDKIKIQNNIKN